MPIEMLDLEAAREEIANGAKLIDVREQNEWDESHVDAGAAWCPGRVGRAPRRGRPRQLGAPRAALPHRQPLREDGRRARLARLRQRRPSSRAGSWRGKRRAADRQRLRPDPGAADALLAPHHALEVGVEGQLKLLESKVLLLGAGGLGAPCALYLAAAGVGTIGIVDDDVVDESNLQRQVIHNTARSGWRRRPRPKRRSRRSTPTSRWSSTTPGSTRRTSST